MIRRFLIRLAILTLVFTTTIHAASYRVDSQEALTRALQSLDPGDVVTIEAGTYEDWSVVIGAEGTKDRPIVIEAEFHGKVVFTGPTHFKVSGRHVVLKDLAFENFEMRDKPTVELSGAENCLVTGNTFRHGKGNRPVVRFTAGAHHNVVEHCRFVDIAGRSVNVHVNEAVYEQGVPAHNVIRNNRFEDIPPLGRNGRETIKIGQNQPEFGHIKTYTLVEDNRFVRCNGEGEIISNKSSYNSYRRNTFIDSEGELVMRGGTYCLIEGNRFLNCSGGIRLSGTNHTVTGNTVVNSSGTGIRLLYGMTREQGGHYQAVRDCVISNNTVVNAGRAGILIGDGRERDWNEKGKQSIAPENNRIEDNWIVAPNGQHLISDHAPGNVIAGNVHR